MSTERVTRTVKDVMGVRLQHAYRRVRGAALEVFCREDTPLEEAAAIMEGALTRRIHVLDGTDAVVGYLSLGDLERIPEARDLAARVADVLSREGADRPARKGLHARPEKPGKAD